MNVTESARAAILARIDAAARAAGHHVRLLAVSKTQPADAVRVLAAQGQLAFGENYVQEALAKQTGAAATFLGRVDRGTAVAWIAAADALVFASEKEGCSTVLREAQALGTPVVRV